MPECNFIKLPGGSLMPATDADKEVVDKIKAGRVVNVKFTQVRNYEFHKKMFALLNLAFDYWEPPELPIEVEARWMKQVTPAKNFERFRKDVTILAGYHDAHFRVDGSTRIEAKSISFSNMDEEEFEKLYSSMIDVVLKHVCTQYSAAELESVVERTIAFV